MSSLAIISTCNLNQWSLDFDLNLQNIKISIEKAKQSHSRLRIGPELEISGYGCEDHFLEQDTFRHSWESIVSLLKSDLSDDFLIDVGCPIQHRSIRYNCRLYILNRRILLIRPKLYLANDGNYRETRWFTAYSHTNIFILDEFKLPPFVTHLTGQTSCPFGIAILECNDTSIAAETCEELFTAESPHIAATLSGAEIITNGSASHHSLRKLHTRLELILNATAKCGGAYLYANQQGCDGGRLYYDGCAVICVNGKLIKQASQFCVTDVEVISATIDLEDIRSYRSAIASRSVQAAQQRNLPSIRVDYDLTQKRTGIKFGLIETSAKMNNELLQTFKNSIHFEKASTSISNSIPNRQTHENSSSSDTFASPSVEPFFHSTNEEIAYGPACWLWDYLRRSGSCGFFLPFSGGADSSATATIVGIMCHLLIEAIGKKDQQVIEDVKRICRFKNDDLNSKSAKDLANRILHTCYMGTAHSSSQTRQRAQKLADEIGSYHLTCEIDPMVAAVLHVFSKLTGRSPQFKIHGGSNTENLAMQNIQARLRMVFAYVLAQLLPWCRGSDSKKDQNEHQTPKQSKQLQHSSFGWLLVLGSANVDESLRGYMTKYDCSSADINPIGGIAKGDLKSFLRWASEKYYPSLREVVEATPTAELEPTGENYVQSDEADMGMSYEELGIYGRLRKIYRCGPVSMYDKLRSQWTVTRNLTPTVIAEKIKKFFYYYSVNRHKLTTLTPAYHAENYSAEDHRFDHRPFLYNNTWKRQFNDIDALAKADQKEYEKQHQSEKAGSKL